MKIRYSRLVPPFIFTCDIIILNIALQVSHYILLRYYSSEIQSANFFLLANLVWISIASVTKNYILKRPLVFADSINRFLTSVVYHLVVILGIIYFFRLYEVSRWEIAITYTIFCVLIIFQRSMVFYALDLIRKKGYNVKHVMVLGNQEIAKRLVGSFKQHPEYGYNFINAVPVDLNDSTNKENLFDDILNARPDELFICYKYIDQCFLQDLIDFGDQNSIKIKFVSDLVLTDNYASIVNYEHFPVIQLSSTQEIGLKIVVFKRSFDVMFSLFIMIAGLPMFVLLAIITRLTSKGPVFFRQERVGKNQKPFHMYKFRSMYVNSEQAGPQLSSDNDPRITKWGRFMRKSRLDELPQFWNVLKGDMSVVGPRPERQFFIDQILAQTPNYKKLLRLKPGLTSLGQINYGYAQSVEEMRNRVRYDLIYLNNINFNSDINIIIQTIRVMTQLKGK